MNTDWPLWEVFLRSKRGLNHVQRRLAARRRRPDGAAPRARPVHPAQRGGQHLGHPGRRHHRVQPDEKDPFFAPSGDKVLYRPTRPFYDIPDSVPHI